MTINSITDNSILTKYNLSNIQSVNTATATDTDATDASSISGVQGLGSDTASISKPGDLMAKLQKLKETDPEKFKQVCNDIAAKLSSAAQTSGDSKLSEMADKFKDVANGGDISQLTPLKHSHKHMDSGYKQENQSSVASMSQNDHKSGMKELMDSIFSEVDDALAA